MKKISIYSIFIACAMIFVGCQQEFNGTIKATIEGYQGNNKVYLNENRYACWNDNDSVNINGTTLALKYQEDNTAIIRLENITEPPQSITAIYPASYANGYSETQNEVTINYTLPKMQLYRTDGQGNQIIEAPMVAYSNDVNSDLQFKNAGALIQVKVLNDKDHEIQLRRIELYGGTNVKLWGNAQYKLTPNGEPTNFSITNNVVEGSDKIFLSFDQEPVTLGAQESRLFYIAVPCVTTSMRAIPYYTIDQKNYKYQSKREGVVNRIARNAIYRIDLSNPAIIEGEHEAVKLIGNGIETDPYMIYTNKDFLKTDGYATTVTKWYKQNNDITLESGDKRPFQFAGTYDGNGKTINIGTSEAPMSDNLGGAFRALKNGATIKNLTVNAYITHTDPVQEGVAREMGGLANITYNDEITIENCTINGTINGNSYVGGFIGLANMQADSRETHSTITINNCKSNVILHNQKGLPNRCGTAIGMIKKNTTVNISGTPTITAENAYGTKAEEGVTINVN